MISHIYSAIAQGKTLSKRDIYYRDVKLFKSQQIVDQVIEQLCQTLEVPRHALNVESASKGMVRGPLKLVKNGQVIDCSISDHLISSVDFDEASIECHAIIVIEKEAVFRILAGQGLPYLFVTGKGCKSIKTAINNRPRSHDPPLLEVLKVVLSDFEDTDDSVDSVPGARGL